MPRKEIDITQVEALAQIGATHDEIATVLGVSPMTFATRMEDKAVRAAWERGRAKMRLSVRRQQLKACEEGNPAMLIWMGKQILGQRDYQRLEMTGPEEGPIEIRADSTAAERILSAIARIAERNASQGTVVDVDPATASVPGVRLERLLGSTEPAAS